MGTFYIFDCGYNPENPGFKHDLTLNIAFEEPPNTLDYMFEETYPDDTDDFVRRVAALLLKGLGMHGPQPHKVVFGLPSHPGPEYMDGFHMLYGTPKTPAGDALRAHLKNCGVEFEVQYT